MKNQFIKRLAGVTVFMVLATQLILPVYATEEASNTASSANSSVTTCKTGDVNCKESGATSTTSQTSATDPKTSSGDASSATANTSTAGTATSATSSGVSITTSTGAVDANKVVESVDATTSTSANTTVNAVMKNLEGASDSTMVKTVESVESAVIDKINKLNKEILQKPKESIKLLKEIEQLKNMRTQLRAKTLEVNKELVGNLRKVEHAANLFEIRWGNLNSRYKVCTAVSAKELKDALDKNEVPAKCEDINKIDYKGKIAVNVGSLKVQKKVLFEGNDKVTVESGSAIGFESNIAGHWDGLIVEYIAPTDSDTATSKKELEVTISIGDLNKTYKGSEIFGKKDIGNKHMIEIKSLVKIMPGSTKSEQDKIIKNRLQIQDKISSLLEKLKKLQLTSNVDSGTDAIEKVIATIDDYNLDDTSVGNVETEIDNVVAALTDTASAASVSTQASALAAKIANVKKSAVALKFAQKLIPFKDTDDNQWYTKYVSAVKNLGIVGGYKDKSGNELGEYRPANNVTVAEILKIGLETADKDKETGTTPKLGIAAKHWAKEYVAKGEKLGLDLVKNTQSLDRPATRGEVIRMMLEALEIKPASVSATSFSDVSSSDKNAAYIEYAKNIGVVSGDDGKDTFRPNSPINRAEVAKIADLINSTIVGNSDDSSSSDGSSSSDDTSATPINLP